MPQAHKREEIQSCNVLRAVRVCKLHTVGPETTAASVPRARPVWCPGQRRAGCWRPGRSRHPACRGFRAFCGLQDAEQQRCWWQRSVVGVPSPDTVMYCTPAKRLSLLGDLSGCSAPLFPVPFLWFAAFFRGAAMACGPGAALRAPETRGRAGTDGAPQRDLPPLARSLWQRKGAVLEHPGNFSWPMVVENHQELVFLSNKVPLCT